MLGVDTNILLYSLNVHSVWHSEAVRFLNDSLRISNETVVLTDYVLVELYTHLRNPSIMAKPLSALEARDLVISYLMIPNIIRIENANIMDAVWNLAGHRNFPRRRIFDARIALTLIEAGTTHFATCNVKDFQDFGFQKVWNPLAE